MYILIVFSLWYGHSFGFSTEFSSIERCYSAAEIIKKQADSSEVHVSCVSK